MKRPQEHVTDERGEQLVRRSLPAEWIVRNLPKDYGVDLEIEIVDEVVVTGKRIWVQLKSVNSSELRTKAFDDDLSVDYISIRVETKFVKYALECTFPLLLFLADLGREEVYWLPVRDHVTKCLEPQKPHWRDQETVSLTVPTWNRLSLEKECDYLGLRWYALEPARFYGFALLHDEFLQFEARGGRLTGYTFDEDGISADEAPNLHRSIVLASKYIEEALKIDTLFGSNGPPYLRNQVKADAEEAMTRASRAVQLLDQGSFDVSEMAKHIFRVDYTLTMLSRAVGLYPL